MTTANDISAFCTDSIIESLNIQIEDLSARLLHKDYLLQQEYAKNKEYRTKLSKLRAQIKQLRFPDTNP